MPETDNDQDLNALNLEVKDETVEETEETETKGDDWKDKQRVPYRRLEAQSRKAQQLEKELNDLKGKFETFTKKPDSTGVWDNRIKNAQSWDEVFNELPKQFLNVLLENPEMKSQFVNAVKGELKGEETKIEEKVNQEIDALWDKDIITSKEQENRVIKYAIKESEESGEYIPLVVAVRMMKKEGVWDKKIEDRSDANSKVRPGSGGSSPKGGEKSNYKNFQHKNIDEIIMDAASKFNK